VSTLDVRTRTSADVRSVGAIEFFDGELPELISHRAALAVPAARELGVVPFTFAVGERCWTIALAGESFALAAGDTGAARVELDDDDVGRIVDDRMTPMTLVASARLRMTRGQLGAFLDWWVMLRSMIDGVAAHTRGAVTFSDTRGDPLDGFRSFGPDDDDEEIAQFLREAGCLHLRGWFEPSEMAAIDADITAALPTYLPDDGASWWARTADGAHRAVRLQGFERHSVTLRSLLADDRFLRIGRLTDDGYIPRTTAEALEKPIGVVEGISDLMWHKDCSLGMHSYNCSGLTVGVSVTGADARSGQLAVVPGSHRALVQPAFHRREWGLAVRELPTRVGDLTVHCSCTLHMSFPPVDTERRVLYTGFGLPPRDGAIVEHQADIKSVREQAYKKVSQAPSPVAATAGE
jgi:hypothetical protein